MVKICVIKRVVKHRPAVPCLSHLAVSMGQLHAEDLHKGLIERTARGASRRGPNSCRLAKVIRKRKLIVLGCPPNGTAVAVRAAAGANRFRYRVSEHLDFLAIIVHRTPLIHPTLRRSIELISPPRTLLSRHMFTA